MSVLNRLVRSYKDIPWNSYIPAFEANILSNKAVEVDQDYFNGLRISLTILILAINEENYLYPSGGRVIALHDETLDKVIELFANSSEDQLQEIGIEKNSIISSKEVISFYKILDKKQLFALELIYQDFFNELVTIGNDDHQPYLPNSIFSLEFEPEAEDRNHAFDSKNLSYKGIFADYSHLKFKFK